MNGSLQVVSAVQEELAARGAISFERLMEQCLYHPAGGFYRVGCPPRGSGAGGHYATCAHIDPALGSAIARWLVQARKESLGSPLRWHVIEVGGGDGTLAETVLSALPLTLRPGLTYHMVEISEQGQALQRQRLGARLRWSSSVAEALSHGRGRALIFSNELVDAFPAVALERRGDRWHEVFLVDDGGRLREELRDPGDWATADGPLSVLSLEGVPEGGRAEAHPSYHRWLRSWVPAWSAGQMLTIDYGDSCEGLYAGGGGGTLRAYYGSQRLDDRRELTERLGQQDLTCDVSFTDLEAWGEGLGLRTLGNWTQRELLARHGALGPGKRRASLDFVAHPDGAGGAFRALVQQSSRG